MSRSIATLDVFAWRGFAKDGPWEKLLVTLDQGCVGLRSPLKRSIRWLNHVKVFRKALLGVIITVLIIIVVLWWYVLSGLCASPSNPNVATQNTIAFNCHGSIVYITPLEQALLHWLIPGGFLVILAGHLVRRWQPRA